MIPTEFEVLLLVFSEWHMRCSIGNFNSYVSYDQSVFTCTQGYQPLEGLDK